MHLQCGPEIESTFVNAPLPNHTTVSAKADSGGTATAEAKPNATA